MEKPRINVYTCKAGHQTITIDKDHGVTPMMLDCRHPGCKESGMSSFYRVPEGLTPQWEWYMPTDEELELEIMQLQLKMPDDGTRHYQRWLEGSRESFKEHRDKGGLFLRKIAS